MASRDEEQRVIRVFVSSTFLDMKAERDELVLRVFPQLRKLCESRGVTWVEIDLRWGITDEQAAEGKVLPICLEEVRRCRPYFIGLLGERYGMVNTEYSEEVLEREPWLGEHIEQGKSLTELEMLHGVLNNPDLAQHAFFYFRDPAYSGRLPSDVEQANFVSEGEIKRDKLTGLKARIREASERKICSLRQEHFRDAEHLGQWILEDFTALIDRLYPDQDKPDHFTRMRIDHEATARSKAHVYIGRQEYFDHLDAFVASEAPDLRPLVVLGESGLGKSALLANWASRYQREHPDDFLLTHFIGATPDSADHIGLLRRIMLELKARCELTGEVPAQPDKIRDEFPNWLTQVAGRHRIILVLDALNQIEERDNAQHLGWLPRIFPRNVRLIVSTLPGPCLDALKARDWMQNTKPLTIQPLTKAERRELARRFLKASSRALSPARLDRLIDAEQTANPLFLRAMLDELRVMGEYEKLDAQIDDYLAASDARALYVKIIERWISIYSEGRDLVVRSLRLLWAARRGLSEAELLDLLGKEGKPLPRALWTPFFLAAEPALVTRSGLLGFAHQYVREAAYLSLVNEEQTWLATHGVLADYFGDQEGMSFRKADEWPWGLLLARRHQDLVKVLVDMWVLRPLAQLVYTDVLGYWRSLAPHADIVQRYEAAWKRATETTNYSIARMVTDYANTIGRILEDCGHWSDAATFYERYMRRRMLEHESQGLSVQVACRNYASCLARLGKYSEAEPLLQKALDELVQLVGIHHPDVLDTASDLARVLQQQGDFDGAQNLHRWVLDISLFGVRPSKSASLYAIAFARFLREWDEKEEALQLAQEAAESLVTLLGSDAQETLLAKLDVGVLKCELGDYRTGIPTLSRVAAALERLLGTAHPQAQMAVAALTRWTTRELPNTLATNGGSSQ